MSEMSNEKYTFRERRERFEALPNQGKILDYEEALSSVDSDTPEVLLHLAVKMMMQVVEWRKEEIFKNYCS